MRISLLLGFSLLILSFDCKTCNPVAHISNQSAPGNEWLFNFGTSQAKTGYIHVDHSTLYNEKIGYGFIPIGKLVRINRNEKDVLYGSYVTSDSPFYFQVNIPEGNYVVTVVLGDFDSDTESTVKAESRRLMINQFVTKKGEIKTLKFAVNVRTPVIDSTKSIQLKEREFAYLNWDDKLTLEFSRNSCINAIEIREKKDLITVFLAGNSTVVDQEYEPYAAWGQMLPAFFNENVVVANYAESGESMKSFEASNRFEKILSLMKPGDYMFIQFGHNDQKPGNNYLEAKTTYKKYLKKYIHEVKNRGGIPVLVSSMHRRKFNANGEIVNTHGDYPQGVREVAREENVAFIDLNEMSKQFYETLGVEGSKKAFIHYPAGSFPNQEKLLEDNSHHSNYGAYHLAMCIVVGIKDNQLDLTKHIRDELQIYKPEVPIPYKEWSLPGSPVKLVYKPEGN